MSEQSQQPLSLGPSDDPDRRRFMQAAGLAGVAVGLNETLLPGEEPTNSLTLTHTGPNEVPHKPFGRTKETVSIMGLGGFSLGMASSQAEATRILQEAVDAGVTFLDNAWEYNNHRSEEWMGQALRGRRDRVFLMTKVCTHGRDKQVAMRQLEESLPMRLIAAFRHKCCRSSIAAASRPWA